VVPSRDADGRYSVIVHCAFNMRRDVQSADLHAYLADTLFLTREVARVPHRKFILLSSIDVYPATDTEQDEDSPIPAFEPRNLYATAKLACESIVLHECENALIIRAGLLLGKYMRPNNLTRVLRGDPGPVTLTADSAFYCILYSDVLEFVRLALERDLRGVFNAFRRPAVTLEELAVRFDRGVSFGRFRYSPPALSNARIAARCPRFEGSAWEALESLAQGGT
jgi:dTDP-4-dehydrorhamnose reductase